MQRLVTGLAALGIAFTLSACVVAPANPYPPPPPLRAEVIPPPPPGRVWEPGHWRWSGATYVWVPGIYVVRRPGWHRYVHPHWERRPRGWAWAPGRWE